MPTAGTFSRSNRRPALSDRLAILICTASGRTSRLVLDAAGPRPAAHALDAVEVEIHLAGPAVRLLVDGLADSLYPTPAQES